MSDFDEKLTSKERMESVVEAGIGLIPYVGGAISSLYYGNKQELRFKRVESFLQTVSDEVGRHGIRLLDIEQHDKYKLISIIEETLEKIENETRKEKIQMFKNYFINNLTHPVQERFDEKRFFLDTLNTMSLLECELLRVLQAEQSPCLVHQISKPDVDQYAIVGAVGRLKTFGYIKATSGQMHIGGGIDNSLNEFISISTFGQSFCNFCFG